MNGLRAPTSGFASALARPRIRGMKRSLLPGQAPHTRGFTLIELMVAVAVVAIIAAVAFPSYQGSIRKSRRSEAFAALAVIQQAQERWRGNHATYGALADLQTVNTNILATTPSGRYAITVSISTDPVVAAQSYTATAAAQGGQAQDASCALLAVLMNGGNLSYGSGSSTPDWSDPGRCWAK